MRKEVKRGFTLVEVVLFLAVTGLLFIGIIVGIQGSLFQQRYNDSVQSFAEFLRTIYSQTMNVENNFIDGSGRSNKAIYGKLIVFGEEKDLTGGENKDNAIFSYTVIGDADGSVGSGNVLEALTNINVNVFVENTDSYELAGVVEQYFPRWEAGIQTTNGFGKVESGKYENFEGALLIIRHPNSGTVFTYVLKGETIEINKMLNMPSMPNPFDDILWYNDGYGFTSKFRIEDVDFCVNPDGERESIRRDVRVVAGSRNASGVEVIGQDDNSEIEQDSGGKLRVGNRCE